MTYPVLEMEVIREAEALGLIKDSDPQVQLGLAYKNIALVMDGELEDDMSVIVDGVARVLTNLIVYCAQKDLDLTECLRKGLRK